MYMSSLTNYIKTTFDGILVIGDVHSDYTSLMLAVEYAKSQNLFLISLGDLVDRGDFPFEVLTSLHTLVKDGFSALTIGTMMINFTGMQKDIRLLFRLAEKGH